MRRRPEARSCWPGTRSRARMRTNWLALRRIHIGFVFQFFNLLEGMSVLENVVLAAVIAGAPRQLGRGESARPARPARAWAKGGRPPGRPLRRPAPAAGDRPRPGERADTAAGGRAHRCARLGGAAEVLELFRRLHAAARRFCWSPMTARGRGGRADRVHAGRADQDAATRPISSAAGDVTWLPSAPAARRVALAMARLAGAGRSGRRRGRACDRHRCGGAANGCTVARWRAGAEAMDVWVGRGGISGWGGLRPGRAAAAGGAGARGRWTSLTGAAPTRAAPVTVNETEMNAPIDGSDCRP